MANLSLTFILSVLLASVATIIIHIHNLPTPPPVQLSELPETLQNWYALGEHYVINGYKMFAIVAEYEGPKQPAPPTLILIHGFPSSSYDYHKALPMLKKKARIVMFDHLGFGFSERPKENFTYSLIEHAENALSLWQTLGIKHAHIVAHDMGDSVMTEILTRYQKGVIQDYFHNFIDSVTFTNGGMRYNMINFRLSQTLLCIPYVREAMISIVVKFPSMNQVSRHQMQSIWGKVEDVAERERDISELQIMNSFNINANENGVILDKTIYYLNDRAVFEPRWMRALSQLKIPIRLVWGDSDAVSPVTIPQSIKHEVVPEAQITILKGIGHFLMLEQPHIWTVEITKDIN